MLQNELPDKWQGRDVMIFLEDAFVDGVGNIKGDGISKIKIEFLIAYVHPSNDVIAELEEETAKERKV